MSHGTRSSASRLVDAVLEASVAGSFSRVGFAVRSRTERWDPPAGLAGRVAVVTGASSGIGRAVALEVARLGATTWVLGRDRARTEAVARDARALGGGGGIEPVVLDVNDADAVRAFSGLVASVHDRLDVVVHAAGALYPTFRSAPDGSELTVATAVLAPFRLTLLLSPLLRRSEAANIVTLSSGGMYTERFDLDHLEMPPDSYRGTTAYRAGEAGPGRPLPRVGPPLGRRRRGELRLASGLGGHPRPGQRPSFLRQARPAPADTGRRSGHRGLARRRRGAPGRPGCADDRGFLPRPAPAGRALPAVVGAHVLRRGGSAAVGLVRIPDGPSEAPGVPPRAPASPPQAPASPDAMP